jgi:hypothetical protein
MYTYFTKDEIEAKISKVEACGSVIVDLKENDDIVLVKFGGDAPFKHVLADDVAKKITSNDDACAVVDCDEGMMVFPSKRDKEEYRGRGV